jgi:uncharacterized membrane protein
MTFPRQATLQTIITVMLEYGTWLASIIIALGLAESFFSAAPSHAVTGGYKMIVSGIGLLICLPIFRLLIMLIAFLRDRDHLHGAIAAGVLTIIGVSFAVGMIMAHPAKNSVSIRMPKCCARYKNVLGNISLGRASPGT